MHITNTRLEGRSVLRGSQIKSSYTWEEEENASNLEESNHSFEEEVVFIHEEL